MPPGDICRYQYRLCTFASFPGSYRTHVELARAGFYYIGKKHEVTCGWCESRVEDWAEGDDPRSRYWHNTGCMMLTQRQDWVQGDDPRSRDRYNTDRMILAQVDHSSVASRKLIVMNLLFSSLFYCCILRTSYGVCFKFLICAHSLRSA